MKIAWLCVLAFSTAALALDYPPAAKKPVSDTFHGVTVTEDYRWLEDAANPEVKAWSEKQFALARATLDAMPQRAKLRERFAAFNQSAAIRYQRFQHAGGELFAMKRTPPRNQPALVTIRSVDEPASERVVVDPNAIDSKGTTAIDWYAPSLDGRYVAVALSERGSEDGAAHVYEVATGRKLDDVVPRVQYATAGGSIAWDADATGFYYTRYPLPGERPAEDLHFFQQVWFHKLGSPASTDKYVIGREFPRIAEISLATTRDGRYLLATVKNGDGGEVAYWLRNPSHRWTKVAAFDEGVKSMELGFDGRIYAIARKGTPRGRVIAMPMAQPILSLAREVVPQGDGVIEALSPTATRLYVVTMAGGPTEVRVYGLDGKPQGTLPSEPVSRNGIGTRLEDDEILVNGNSYLSPFAWYRYGRKGTTLEPTPFAEKSPVDFKDAEVVREMARSKDGTMVPVNLVMRKGTKRDGSNPVLLYGYGGYGLSQLPVFSDRIRVWLDAGGIYAVANLRGGGEFGEAWHLAGNLTKKQNVFDDMIGVAEHLVARGYTKPERLAAMGGSNGGLLMGAILTQRPELFRAIVSSVGIHDMLRVELSPNGAFNVTEFGSVKDKAQFEALHAYSPYHRVKDKTAYPAVFLTSGANDGRVDPANSRKMAARLQAATSSGRPVLLRINPDTGHGRGTSMATRVEQDADTYAFLMNQLGMNP